MKKILIVLMACAFFIACNNDKGAEKKADYRDKDDYSTTDDKTTNDKTTDDKNKDDDDKQTDDKSKKNDDDPVVTTNDGWSENDNNRFTSECMTGFGEQQAIGKKICPCALEKFQQKYSSYADLDAKSSEAEGKKIGEQCKDELNIEIPDNNNNVDQDDYSHGGWTSNEVKKFVGDCVATAQKSGMEELDAQSYCDCMQDKLSKIYPSYKDASKLTKADLATPSIKRMIQSCLPGN